MVATLQSQNELLEAPPENRKICGFRVALGDSDQPASLYCLLVVVLLGTSSQISTIGFRHRLWACTQRKCQSFFSIRGFVATAFIGLRGRTLLRPVP